MILCFDVFNAKLERIRRGAGKGIYTCQTRPNFSTESVGVLAETYPLILHHNPKQAVAQPDKQTMSSFFSKKSGGSSQDTGGNSKFSSLASSTKKQFVRPGPEKQRRFDLQTNRFADEYICGGEITELDPKKFEGPMGDVHYSGYSTSGEFGLMVYNNTHSGLSLWRGTYPDLAGTNPNPSMTLPSQTSTSPPMTGSYGFEALSLGTHMTEASKLEAEHQGRTGNPGEPPLAYYYSLNGALQSQPQNMTLETHFGKGNPFNLEVDGSGMYVGQEAQNNLMKTSQHPYMVARVMGKDFKDVEDFWLEKAGNRCQMGIAWHLVPPSGSKCEGHIPQHHKWSDLMTRVLQSQTWNQGKDAGIGEVDAAIDSANSNCTSITSNRD